MHGKDGCVLDVDMAGDQEVFVNATLRPLQAFVMNKMEADWPLQALAHVEGRTAAVFACAVEARTTREKR